MQDKMTEIRGYFKVDSLDKNGKIISTYEDNNTVMARIPELFAGQASGLYVNDITNYVICTIALGTGGVKNDDLGNKIPKSVRDNRSMMFAEEAFWNISDVASDTGDPAVLVEESTVYQQTFAVNPTGDLGSNTAIFANCGLISNGSTLPFDTVTGLPTSYVNRPYGAPPADNENIKVEIMNRGREIKYIFTVGQFAANSSTDTAIPYSEAAMYMKVNSDAVLFSPPAVVTENPLGQLFSMKTFEPQYKNSTCSLRIEWSLFF